MEKEINGWHVDDAPPEGTTLEGLNKRIQNFLSRRGVEVPVELIKMLSDLDWWVKSDHDHICDSSNPDCAAYLFYANPENRRITGSARKRV